MSVHDAYDDARAAAQQQANLHDREMGVRRAREYGRTRFVVQHLPRVDKRFGDDARCEVVSPDHQ